MSKMQEESDNDSQLKNNGSIIFRLSSNQSIDKISQRSQNNSLADKDSLLNVLDMQGRKRKASSGHISQFDQDSQNQRHRYSVCSSKSKQPDLSMSQNLKMFDSIPDFDDSLKQNNRHECICPKQGCSEDGCPCSLAINQLCFIGLCCPDCIRKKNNFMSGQSSRIQQNNKQKKPLQNNTNRQNKHLKSIKKVPKARVHKQKYDFVYCTCKKTQCMKKYCPCYALIKQCNECCICQECQNCSDQYSSDEQKRNRKQRLNQVQDEQKQKGNNSQDIIKQSEQNIAQQIDNYFQQSPDNYQHVELNKVMDFQPVDFGCYRINNK